MLSDAQNETGFFEHSLAAARNDVAFVASEGKMLQKKFTRNWCRCCPIFYLA
jgi:hypothetical protein